MDSGKKQKGKFFTSKLLFQSTGILFFLVIIAMIFADFKIYQKKQELISQISDYQKQIEDIKNAVTFLSAQPEVDKERIGLWGTSYGGANAILCGSRDR